MALATNLWDKAFQSLSPDLQTNLGATKTHRRHVLDAVLKDAEDKRMLSLRKRWKYTKPNGDTIIVRDVLEKIVRWVEKFKETGDIIVQYDPGHAALPWAAVRFLLRIAVSEVQLFVALVEDLEYIARMMVRYRAFENLYLSGSQSEIKKRLVDALTCLYAEILTHLSIAVKFFQETTLTRLLKSPFRSVNEERAKAMSDREKEVDAFSKLADAETLRSLDAGFTRLSTQTSRYLAEEKYNNISEWLAVAPYYLHHRFLAQSRLPNLGRWLFSQTEYTNWHTSSSPSLLLIHGIAGSGKSTLCSVIVDDILVAATNNPSAAPFAYFYCANLESEKDRRSSDSVMRTIVFQLGLDTSHPMKMRDFLCAEYERQLLQARAGKLDMPRLTTKDCVRLILELAEEDPLTIVIDGIDAVDDTDRPILIQALREIVSNADNIVKILVTSRTSSHVAAVPASDFRIQITSQETQCDMEVFVDRLIDNAVASKVLLQGNVCVDTQRLLKHELLTRAGEMFLLARLQVERICRETFEDDVITALQRKLPDGIDQLYQESLMHILDGGDLAREIATKTISWVLFMREPLTPGALLSALGSGKHKAFDLAQVMATCSNFVVLDTKCNVIRFAHQSVQDFIGRHPDFAAYKAHRLLATCCLDACSHGPSTTFDQSLNIPNDDFYVYAAMYWPIHTEMSQRSHEDTAEANDLVQSVTSFIFDEDWDLTLSFESWVSNGRFLSQLLPRGHVMKSALNAIPEKGSSPLFVLSMYGLDEILVLVLSKVNGLDVNQQNELGHTPVYLAAEFGRARTVEVLVEWGARINVECGRYGSPLHVACFRGHLEVVRKLLHFGALVCCGSVFKNALQAAFRGGYEFVALDLVDLNQTIETEDDYEEALEQASLLGFVNVVQSLQDSRLSTSIKGTPERLKKKTRKAIQGGQVGVLHQFLGRDVANSDYLPPAAVALATLHNQKSMVGFLVDQGMDLEALGDFGSPLRTASLLNFQSIARLLLDKGAQVNASGPFGDSLQAAALNGHIAIVRLLIQEGANINQQSGYYGSALQAAAYHGHLDTVELLIDSNADIDISGYSQSAIHASAEGGHEDIIMLILRKKQRPVPIFGESQLSCAPPPRYKTLLRDASPGFPHSRDPRVSRLQAEAHPDPKASQPITDMETVFRAAKSGTTDYHLGMEQNLTLGFTCDGWKHEHPLEAAASLGHEKTVNWLLRQQQKPLTVSPDTIRSAISVASSRGHSVVVQILLEFIANMSRSSEIKWMEERLLKPLVGEDAAFRLASAHCTPDEFAALSRKYPKHASKYDRASKYHHKYVGEEETLPDFALSCKTGDVQLAASILETEHHRLLSLRSVEEGVQLCGLHGQTKVAQLLLESSILQDRKPPSGKEAFVLAAARGFVDCMRLFVLHWPQLLTAPEARSRALVVSSKYGHLTAVRYLVMELGTEVNISSPDRVFNPSLDVGFSKSRTNTVNKLKKNQATAAMIPVVTPLQASLQGFGDASNALARSDDYFTDERPRDYHQQEEVIRFLLHNGADPNDPGEQQVVPVHMASKHCSRNIVKLLISVGADVNKMGFAKLVEEPRARQKVSFGIPSHLELCPPSSALFEAAGRELSGLPIVRLLITSGASFPEGVDRQSHLLGQALRFFEGETSSTGFRTYYFTNDNPPEGRFEHSSSLNEVFTEGPGSVLFYLLSRMPQAKATGERWTLVLQMAAFLNEEGFVDLLLSRGIDVNATGYYYGTAIQAAARCGHAALARKLLDAGAEVNLTGGRWHTPLRAALVDGHETVICLLLDHVLLDHEADVQLEQNPRESDEYGVSSDERKTVLQLAVQTGNINIVRAILAKGSDARLDVLEGKHPLIIAASKGVKMVRVLLNAGAPVNVQGKRHHPIIPVIDEDASPIHAASAAGHSDIVSILLCSGAEIESTFDGSDTPLTVAASRGNIQVVINLISAGARTHDSAALEKAVRHNHFEVVKVLLASGAMAKGMLTLACHLGNLNIVECLVEPALESHGPETVFNEAYSARGLEDSVTRLLLEYATPTNYQFLLACATASLASVELLLQEEIFDINHTDEYSGDYPLQIAALHLRPDVVRVLTSHGANIDVESSNHGTPLNTALKACAAPQLRAMQGESMRRVVNKLSLPAPRGRSRLIIPFGPDTDRMDPDSNCEKIVKHLIAYGANTERVEPFLGPPLHLACLLGSRPLVELLLSSVQNGNSTVGHFETPLFAAIQGRNSHITSLLLQHVSLVNHVHAVYGTALHHACRVGDDSSAKLLLEHGADATIRDFRGQTSLTVALQKELESQHARPEAAFEGMLTIASTLPDLATPKSMRKSQRQQQMNESTPLKAILDLANPMHISNEDLALAADLSRGHYFNRRYVLGQLFCMDSSRLTTHHRPAIDALEMVLKHDHSTRVTPKIFLHVFRTGTSSALRLLNLLEGHEKRVYSTTRIKAAVDDAYELESQTAIKERFYGLLTEDESEWDSAGSDADSISDADTAGYW